MNLLKKKTELTIHKFATGFYVPDCKHVAQNLKSQMGKILSEIDKLKKKIWAQGKPQWSSHDSVYWQTHRWMDKQDETNISSLQLQWSGGYK